MTAFGKRTVLFFASFLAAATCLHAAQVKPVDLPRLTTSVAIDFCNGTPSAPGLTPAEATVRPRATFPDVDQKESSEGWVRLDFTIAADGSTRDIVATDRLGSEDIVKSATKALSLARYRPATVNGQPIAQYNNNFEFLYRFEDVSRQAEHAEFVSKYDRGRALLRNRKYGEATAVLESAYQLRLNLYELAMLSYALALTYAGTNDTPRALLNIRHAAIEGGIFLERKVAPPVRRLRLKLEAMNSNYRYVACSPPFAEADPFEDDEEDRKEVTRIVTEVRAAITNPAPLALEGKLATNPWIGGAAMWEHGLLRRKFAFDSIKGTVRNLVLACWTQVIESPVNETSQWSIPESAGRCTLRVYGEPGATFRLIEEW